MYSHLRSHYQFINETKLFPDVGNSRTHSINVYGRSHDEVRSSNISNLFHPSTVSRCFSHTDSNAPIPGLKDDANEWNVKPHCERIVEIGHEELSLFTQLLEESGSDPLEARLPQVHAGVIVNVVHKLAKSPQRLDDNVSG